LQNSKTLAVLSGPPSGFSTYSTISSCTHPIYSVEVCKRWKMPRSRKETLKVIENNKQRAKTASPIRKRPAGQRRAISQPQAQRLDQLAEAASVAEPADIPSEQIPASAASASASDDQDLPPVRKIVQHASARSRVSRSPSFSLTDQPKEYYIE
jgi:hypothetical protein